MELERRLAAFKKTEAVVVFQSGFAANAGTVAAVLTKDDVVISDELNHASIIDGCRLSRAAIKVFPHKDVDAARKILHGAAGRPAQAAHHRRRLQHGRRPRRAAGAVRAGRGVRLHHDGRRCARERRVRQERPRHHRSLRDARPRRHPGRHAVEGDRRARRIRRRQPQRSIEFLYHRARPFLFSTSHPPAVAAACIAALDVLEQEPQIIERLWENTRFFKAGLEALGFNTGLSESPITPVIVGDGALAMKLSDRLFEEGVFAQGIAFPTVARDKARVRTIVTATHTRDELQFALDVFAKVGRELGILKPGGSDSRSVAVTVPIVDDLLRHLHEGSEGRRSAAPLHARHARSLQVLHARRRSGRAQGAAVAPARLAHVRLLFVAFTMKLSPARRVVYGAALAAVRRSV